MNVKMDAGCIAISCPKFEGDFDPSAKKLIIPKRLQLISLQALWAHRVVGGPPPPFRLNPLKTPADSFSLTTPVALMRRTEEEEEVVGGGSGRELREGTGEQPL